jgi:hypothetical protein
MNTSQTSFPCRVRIHGRECGAVARALHHEAKTFVFASRTQDRLVYDLRKESNV